jgi:rare lipoprotein A (peptidoglycan hydrolase)
MHKSIYLLFIILFCLVKESNAQTNITAHKWQNSSSNSCYTAKFDAPLNTILEVNYHSKVVFIEVVERISDSTMLELSECAWEKLDLSLYATTVNLEIKIQDSKNAITVNLPNRTDFSQSDNLIINQNTFDTLPIIYPTTTENPFEELNDNPQTIPSTNNINITENGYAKLGNIIDARPFIALHKTAPIGTMMIVKNPVTGANTVVEVVGQIQDIYPSAGVIIELTPAAFSRLGSDPANLLEVELRYTSSPKDLINKRSHTEKIKVEAFQSSNIINEAIALHSSIPSGTMIYLKQPNQKEIALTIMGKPKNNSKALQISDTLYKTLEMAKNQSNWSIEYNDFQSKSNFEIYANVFEDVSAIKHSNTTEKMAIWHKTIPIGTSVLIKNIVSTDMYGNKLFSTRLVKVVGKLEESTEEDIQLSPDLWQVITISSTSNNVTSDISKSPDNEAKLALYLSYFSL